MSTTMQLVVSLSYGTLLMSLAWRFNRSKWADMRVADIICNDPDVQEFLRREIMKHAEQRRQWDELMALYQRDAERLQIRLDGDRGRQ